MRLLAAALACILLAACATQPASPERAQSYKRVGVLSAMGDRFAVAATGFTVFGNEFREEKVEFGADDVLTEKAVAALATKYEVVDLTKYRAAFLAQPKYWPGQKGMFAPDRPMAQDVVRNLMGEEKLDAYLVLTPASFVVRGTNQGGGGIGIMKLGSSHLLHLAYIVTVVDGKDFSYTADMRAIPTDETTNMGFVSGSSRLNSPNRTVPAQYSQAPKDNADGLRSEFSTLAGDSVPQTLKRANLLP